jgi:hypothetical protein
VVGSAPWSAKVSAIWPMKARQICAIAGLTGIVRAIRWRLQTGQIRDFDGKNRHETRREFLSLSEKVRGTPPLRLFPVTLPDQLILSFRHVMVGDKGPIRFRLFRKYGRFSQISSRGEKVLQHGLGFLEIVAQT